MIMTKTVTCRRVPGFGGLNDEIPVLDLGVLALADCGRQVALKGGVVARGSQGNTVECFEFNCCFSLS